MKVLMTGGGTAGHINPALAIGLTAQIGLQMLINVAVVSNLIPNTGISLPFFSYGGTSILMLLAQMGVVLSISRQSHMEKT